METSDTSTESDMKEAFGGKVVGIVSESRRVESLCQTMLSLGLEKIELLEGPRGRERLDEWLDTASHYIFGETEQEMVQRYRDAVHQGYVIFAVDVESTDARDVAESAKREGATEVVHFGNSVITNY